MFFDSTTEWKMRLVTAHSLEHIYMLWKATSESQVDW